MYTRPLASLSLALLLTACDGPAKDAPVAAKTDPVAVATPPAGVTPPAITPPTPAKPRPTARERALAGFDPGAAKTLAQTFRDQLAAGRTAVKAKDYAAGIAAFTAALKIDPNHPAALAELGWAAYLAGDLTAAQRSTEQAIAGDAPDTTRGAALYNLGRILEDRGDKNGAAAAYQRSLQLRANKTVQERLASLTAAGADATPHDCDFTPHKGGHVGNLCAALVATMPTDEEIREHKCDEQETEPGETVVDAAGTPMGGEPQTKIDHTLADGVRIAHFRVENWIESGGSYDTVYLAVLYADRWYTAELGSAYNPGHSYIGANFTVDSVAARDLIPGGREEIVITMTSEEHDGDYGDNTMESTTDQLVAVLGLDGDAPRWLGTFKVSAQDDTGPMIDGEPSNGPSKHSERKVDHRIDAGQVVITAVPGHEPATPPGTFKLGELPAACPAALGYLAGG